MQLTTTKNKSLCLTILGNGPVHTKKVTLRGTWWALHLPLYSDKKREYIHEIET